MILRNNKQRPQRQHAIVVAYTPPAMGACTGWLLLFGMAVLMFSHTNAG